jgi:hypothetical protein
MMMKKLLMLMLVLCISTSASALTVSLVDPGTVSDSGSTRIYVAVDGLGMDDLALTLDISGDAEWTGGIQAAEAASYATKLTDYGTIVLTDGGWQSDLSADTALSNANKTAELGLGHFGSTPHGATTIPVVTIVNPGDLGIGLSVITPLAYVDITATGDKGATITLTNGSQFGSESSLWEAGAALTIDTIPEPATLALLGLGGLALLRRRK